MDVQKINDTQFSVTPEPVVYSIDDVQLRIDNNQKMIDRLNYQITVIQSFIDNDNILISQATSVGVSIKSSPVQGI